MVDETVKRKGDLYFKEVKPQLIKSKGGIMGIFDIFKSKQSKSKDINQVMQKMAQTLFPGGLQQIEAEAEQLSVLLNSKLNREDAKGLLTRTKALIAIAEDKSPERIVSSIMMNTNGKLTEAEAKAAYNFFIETLDGDLYSGGDGSSASCPVIINATDSTTGIPAEYAWIERRYGQRDKGWSVESRSHGSTDDGRSFETFNIKLKDGTTKSIHFDITAFYGKF